ncbi:MAG: L,D-transpeptidase family protein, partial [Alphaproteobacteria bacterium]|nr:L,D-transpeptidase family protein [Alphaproteobacteria bacterium]
MRKFTSLAPKLLIGMVVLAVGVDSAEAQQKIKQRRIGFFESLFGGNQSAPSTSDFNNFADPSAKLSWFDEQRLAKARRAARLANGGGSVDPFGFPIGNISKNQQKKFAQADRSEPDPLPGLGMGIVAYAPPLTLPVYDTSFLDKKGETPEAETIRIELINKATTIRAVDTERKAILAQYGGNGFRPLWTQAGHITPRAEGILKLLSKADAEGFNPKNYLPIGMESFDKADESLGGDANKLARFDIALTAALLKYTRHISGGQFDPNKLSLYNDIKPQVIAANEALKVLAFTPFPENYIASLEPTHPQFAIFKKALSKESVAENAISGGPNLKPGMMDERVPAIREKLLSAGIKLANTGGTTDPTIYDKSLSNGVRALQKSGNLKVTGVLDVATLSYLNEGRNALARKRIIYNMERLRWLPKSLGTRYVFVNQPAFEVNVVDRGKTIWNSKVIVGKPMNQTSSFYDQIETVVFNPSWGVPASIIVNEYGPKSRKDPGYLDRNGFKVVDSKGQPISSRDIDWYNIGQAPKFGVQQPPGSDNALGELKFLFPNAHDIYMHDT